MKRITFTHKFALSDAVLSGHKTMVRRVVPARLLLKFGHNQHSDKSRELINYAHYKVGDVVAVAQSSCLIRITAVKVERLQDISGDDIAKEGIWLDEKIDRFMVGNKGFFFAKEAFEFLVNEIIGKGTWDCNPFVFVYTFELI